MRGMVGWPGKIGVAASLTVLSLAASASPAAAAVTIGQLAPAVPEVCDADLDVLQPTVTSGNTYVVPATGTVTSWSHVASPVAGKFLAMKIFRKVAEPATYMVVGHDGPRPLTAGALNTFPASIPVRPGDVLGVDTGPVDATGCVFPVPGEVLSFHVGNLADGASGAFVTEVDFRLNISAVVAPDNVFTLGAPELNRKKGTATLTATVPNPGELVLSGKGVKTAGATRAVAVAAPGNVDLLVRAAGKKKRKLKRRGKVKVNPAITYTPAGGDPSVQSRKLKLKKR